MDDTHRIIRPESPYNTECVERESGHERRIRLYTRKIECNERLFEPGTVVAQRKLFDTFDVAAELEKMDQEGLSDDAKD